MPAQREKTRTPFAQVCGTSRSLQAGGCFLGEVTPGKDREEVYLMSQSPLLSTQLCSLFELAFALEKANAKAAMSPDALVDDKAV